ncbi:MAG: mevalonate kinase [Gammaproteobacteria bacterium]
MSSTDGPMTAQAPGKLVLLGEYAVLDGAPAVVAAVDRQVRATATVAPAWSIEAANLDVAPRAWPSAGDRPENDPLALPAALLDALSSRDLLRNIPPQRVSLDSAALFVDGAKLGVGSSAAVLVALYRLVAREDIAWKTAFALIDAAHRACQKGLGSGVDIAAALHGGVIVFERDPRFALANCTPICVPKDLHMTSVFTGAATSTATFLEKIIVWRQRAGWEYTAHRDALAGLASAGVGALNNADAAEFCRIADRYCDVLEAFGVAAGVEIVSPIHRQLRDLARDCGVAYKTSGAGGRDLGVAFATDAAALVRFGQLADQLEHCQTLTLGVAPPTPLSA